MNVVTLQLIFYVIAILSGLLGIFTFGLSWLMRVEDKRHQRRTYSLREKVTYYSSRKNNMKLTYSERNYASKQLKNLLK